MGVPGGGAVMRARFWAGVLAVALIAVGSLAAAALVYVNDRDDFHRMQRDEAARAAHQMEAVAGLSVGKLSSAAAFFEAERDLTAHEFDVIGRSLLSQGTLAGAAYIPRVTASQRAHFESMHGFEILERGPDGELQRAGPRPVYLPLAYVSAVLKSRRGIGYGRATDQQRLPFLRRAG